VRERVWTELTTDDADLYVEKTASSALFPGRCLANRCISWIMAVRWPDTGG
jgi:hypothetical protein